MPRRSELETLIIFKESQAWAVRSIRKLVSQVREFLECPSEGETTSETTGTDDVV